MTKIEADPDIVQGKFLPDWVSAVDPRKYDPILIDRTALRLNTVDYDYSQYTRMHWSHAGYHRWPGV